MKTRPAHRLRACLVSALFGFVLSCSPPKQDPSLQAFEGLLFSLRSGDLDRLWSGLSLESRSWLFAEVGISTSQGSLTLDSPPASLKRALSLQPNWRFEHSWGEGAQRDPQGTSSVEGGWFIFSEHGRRWRVHGLKQAGGWRFDLFHATLSPKSETGSR